MTHDYSTLGSSVFYYLSEFAQIHVHWVSDTIWWSHFLPLPSLHSIFPITRVFSNESTFCIRWKSTVASPSATVLPMNIQGRFHLGLISLISSESKGFSRASSSTTVQKNQFFSAQPSLWSNFHICTWLL